MTRLARFVAFTLFTVLAGIGCASAVDYPTRPVKWIVPYPPGGTTDVLARIMAQWLSDKMGQQFVIENKPGGGNNIGVEVVVNAAPDGYTILLVNPANGINATLYKNLSYNFIRDIAPVRRRRWPSSSPTARRTPARSTWPRRAAAPRRISPASSSSR